MSLELSGVKRIENQVRQCGGISLAQGIPDLPMHDAVKNRTFELMQAYDADMYSSPRGTMELREALVADSTSASTPDNFIVTAGASQAIVATLRTLITAEKDEVIIFTPSYAGYFSMVSAAGGKVVQVQLSSDDWSIDFRQLSVALSRHTACILIAHPNNPTGHVYSVKELNRLLSICSDNFPLITDEVYSNFNFSGDSFVSPYDFSDGNVIRINSFSKWASMTGWRIGYIEAKANTIESILPYHDGIITCAPTPAQNAALASLKYKRLILERTLRFIERQRKVVDLLPSVTLPEWGYYLFLDTQTTDFSNVLLNNYHVGVVPGASFGVGFETFVRVCIARKNLKPGLTSVSSLLSDAAIESERSNQQRSISCRYG